MSTTALIPEQDVKPTVVTYGVYTVTETVKDEKTGEQSTKVTPKATMNEKKLEEAQKDGTLLMTQSFSYDIPGTVAGISTLGISEEEIVNIFRQGLTAKIGRLIVADLQDTDENGNLKFQPVEGNYDARSYGAEISGRRGLTDTEKAMKTLKNLPPDVIAALLASLQAQVAPAGTAAE